MFISKYIDLYRIFFFSYKKPIEIPPNKKIENKNQKNTPRYGTAAGGTAAGGPVYFCDFFFQFVYLAVFL